MRGTKGWAGVSFTLAPPNGRRLEIGEAVIVFPGLGNGGLEPWESGYSGENFFMRIESTQPSSIPPLAKETKGVFQGFNTQHKVMYTVSNASVYESSPGVLVLEAASGDGHTSPVAFAAIEPGD